MVKTESAYDMTRKIVENEGIFVGMSSGAAMCATLEVAKNIDTGTIVVIFPDGGEKYLSTELFKVWYFIRKRSLVQVQYRPFKRTIPETSSLRQTDFLQTEFFYEVHTVYQ